MARVHKTYTLCDYEAAMIRFYNTVAGQDVDSIQDIPKDVLSFLSLLEFEELVKPFVKMDQTKGSSLKQSHIKYGVSIPKIRFWMGKNKKRRVS